MAHNYKLPEKFPRVSGTSHKQSFYFFRKCITHENECQLDKRLISVSTTTKTKKPLKRGLN